MKYVRVLLAAVLLSLLVGFAPRAEAAPAVESTCGSTYIVRYGDTLARIAARCGVTTAALRAANPSIINPNRIYVGQRLNIPGSSGDTCASYYVVRRGDTLARIAARFGTTVTAIRNVNPSITNPNRIYTGQRLCIPAGGSPVFNNVMIALIALDSGDIGCGDGVVLVTRSIAPTQAPLTAAIQELLSIHDQFYGESGLYNALYNSNLAIESIALAGGVATIRLTGNISIGGVCDAPRVEAQFEHTARQFSTVTSVEVFVNGTPLGDLLSGA